MRLEGKVAIVVGRGQTPGETIGNGRATAILFAREGARAMRVDRRQDCAQETEKMIREGGFEAVSFEADVTRSSDCEALAKSCVDEFGRIDVLHNNVGIASGDSSVVKIEEDAWRHIFDVNLDAMLRTCKY